MTPTEQHIIPEIEVLTKSSFIDSHFLANKYTNWYISIITHALKREHLDSYFEKHHILPRCMGGKNKNNMVKLTAREHFICHLLLVKMMKTEFYKIKMQCAIHYLTTNVKHSHLKITSRTFSKIRENFSKAMSIIMKGKIRIQSAEEKRLRSINQKGRFVSEQTKAKISSAHKGRINGPRTEEIKKAISISNIGKLHTTETKNNLSKSIKNLYDSDPTYKKRIAKSVSIANTGKIWMTKETKNRFVTKMDSEILKNNGWIYGRFIAKRRTKIEMLNQRCL